MPSKNIMLSVTLAGLLIGSWGCDDSRKSTKGNVVTGGADGTSDSAGGSGASGTGYDGQAAGSATEATGPTQVFEVNFDGLTVESYVGSEPGSSYVQFRDGDKVVLKENIDRRGAASGDAGSETNSNNYGKTGGASGGSPSSATDIVESDRYEVPKLIYADGAEGPEHLPIRLAKDDVKVVIIGLSKNGGEVTRIYKVSLPPGADVTTAKQVSQLAQVDGNCSLVQTSPGLYELVLHEPSRFSGARRVVLDITLCLESGKVVLDQNAMKVKAPDASKIKDFISEAKVAFAEKEEIKALIKAQKKKGKRGNGAENSEANANAEVSAGAEVSANAEVSAGADVSTNADGSADAALNADEMLAIVPPELADGVLHCIYAGRLDLGRKILDAAWPSGLRGKQKYWQALCAEIAKSPYGEQIRLLNKGHGKFPS